MLPKEVTNLFDFLFVEQGGASASAKRHFLLFFVAGTVGICLFDKEFVASAKLLIIYFGMNNRSNTNSG